MANLVKNFARNAPTYEIYARFSPNTLDPIIALRNKYAPKQIYPRDIGIRLYKNIYKNEKSSTSLDEILRSLSQEVAPFTANFLRPFRNVPSEKKTYSPSVYYEVHKHPFKLLCVYLRKMCNKINKKRDRQQSTKSFKIGISGNIESHEEAENIVKELLTLETPPPLSFDALVLATRPNKIPLSELEEDVKEYPFAATEDTFKIFLEKMEEDRNNYIKLRDEKALASAKKKESKSSESETTPEGEVTTEDAMTKEASEDKPLKKD